jgi:sarcosine oxidase, subunit beta
VIGAGILGVSAALHLQRARVGRVLLLDKSDVATGTSNAGAGLCVPFATGFQPNWREQELALELYGLDWYRALASDHPELNLRAYGTLVLASSPESWDEYVRPLAEGVAGNPLATTADAAQIRRLAPFIAAPPQARAVYYGDGLHLLPRKAALAMARQFAAEAGTVVTGSPVEDLACSAAGVWSVVTPAQTYETETVVMAAGIWTNRLAARVGIWLPIVPFIAHRIVTEPLGLPPDMANLLIPELSGMWIREEEGGLLWGVDYSASPWYDYVYRDPPDDFAHMPSDGYLESEQVRQRALDLIPALGRYRKPVVSYGAPCFTPDTRFLIGGLPGASGLYLVGGDCYAGVTHSPGIGQMIAAIITGKEPLTDPAPFDPGRFAGEVTSQREAVEYLARFDRGFSWHPGRLLALEGGAKPV